MSPAITYRTIVEQVGAGKVVGMIGCNGVHLKHSNEPFKVGLSQDELDGFWRRIGDRIRTLDSKLVNRANVCHIIGDDEDLNLVGYDYVCRRIDSGEAVGSEYKDLRLVKEIAETIMDYRSCQRAVTDGDIVTVNRIMSRYPASKTETRRSRSRRKAVEVV